MGVPFVLLYHSSHVPFQFNPTLAKNHDRLSQIITFSCLIRLMLLLKQHSGWPSITTIPARLNVVCRFNYPKCLCNNSSRHVDVHVKPWYLSLVLYTTWKSRSFSSVPYVSCCLHGRGTCQFLIACLSLELHNAESRLKDTNKVILNLFILFCETLIPWRLINCTRNWQM